MAHASAAASANRKSAVMGSAARADRSWPAGPTATAIQSSERCSGARPVEAQRSPSSRQPAGRCAWVAVQAEVSASGSVMHVMLRRGRADVPSRSPAFVWAGPLRSGVVRGTTSAPGRSRPFRSMVLGAMVLPVNVRRGEKASTMISLMARPLVVHRVVPWPPGRCRNDPRFELRTARLRIISTLLGANIADLDRVRDARYLTNGWGHTWPAIGRDRPDVVPVTWPG